MTVVAEVRAIGRRIWAITKRGRAEDVLGVRQPEHETLVGCLDWYRAVVRNKVTGLALEDASRVMTPTGMSPLGIVKHLAWCEHGWWQGTFAGETEGWKGRTEGFDIGPDDTVESVLADYDDACEHSRRIVAAAGSLEKLSVGRTELRGHVSMRWLLVHMIEETARHVGHLDLMREQIDGNTGD